jgi:hypothetical protein
MKRKIFDTLMNNCVPGPNSDRKKADLLRTFKIPDDLIEEHSSSSNRTVNVFAAWISEEYVWILVDFARLVRFHIISRAKPWSKDDLKPTSPVSILHSLICDTIALIQPQSLGLYFGQLLRQGQTGISNARWPNGC